MIDNVKDRFDGDDTVADQAKDAADSSTETASDAADGIKEAVGNTAESARSAVDDAGAATQESGQDVGEFAPVGAPSPRWRLSRKPQRRRKSLPRAPEKRSTRQSPQHPVDQASQDAAPDTRADSATT